MRDMVQGSPSEGYDTDETGFVDGELESLLSTALERRRPDAVLGRPRRGPSSSSRVASPSAISSSFLFIRERLVILRAAASSYSSSRV
jgi:hypothetical protein